MIITCPNCETRFKVAAAAFIPSGRPVRCAKCSHKWTQRPLDDPEAPPAPPATPAPEAPPDGDEDGADDRGRDDDDDLDDGDIPEIVECPVVPGTGSSGRRGVAAAIVGWSVLVLVIVAVLGSAFFARQSIVDLWPPAGQLYARIGLPVASPYDGLEISAPATKQTRDGDSIVLEVSGEIANSSAEVRAVPRLRIAFVNVRGDEITDWSFTATATQLAPGDATRFVTRYRDPPANARGVEVTFAAPE